MLGWPDDDRLYPKSLSRPERIAHLHIRRSPLRKFCERVDQLLDECGVQDFRSSNFGYRLLSLTFSGPQRPQIVSGRGVLPRLRLVDGAGVFAFW
jgi:hypothetical protein